MYFFFMLKRKCKTILNRVEKNSLNLNLREIFVPSSLFPTGRSNKNLTNLWIKQRNTQVDFVNPKRTQQNKS
jgi:hypothetical protein